MKLRFGFSNDPFACHCVYITGVLWLLVEERHAIGSNEHKYHPLLLKFDSSLDKLRTIQRKRQPAEVRA